MAWLIVVAIILAVVLFSRLRRKTANLASLPQRFVVLDLETTGRDPAQHEIIEIGAIRVNRDSDIHDTFSALVKPIRRIPKRITEITGISQDMVDSEGEPLEKAIGEFTIFIENLPLVTFNAEFDMAFLQDAAKRHNFVIGNPVSCALKMARRAWPGRKSYKLKDLAKDGGLSDEGTHRALGDCKRALIVYSAAASILRVAK
jgi:DNA polymerase III epsilon subunit family exonuclease